MRKMTAAIRCFCGARIDIEANFKDLRQGGLQSFKCACGVNWTVRCRSHALADAYAAGLASPEASHMAGN